MGHKLFRQISIGALTLVACLVGLYDYYQTINVSFILKIILKVLPLLVLILLNISYFIIYRFTIYSVGILITLLFCLSGDIFMAFYNPSLAEISNPKIVWFIAGGTFFLVARILSCVVFVLQPYRKLVLICYPYKKVFLSHLIFFTPFLTLGILLLIYQISFISVSVFLYLFLGFGFTLSYSFLRIGFLPEESKNSSILAFVGILLFSLSDILLLLSMLDFIPSIFILISDNIYWLSMSFLTISIVRSSEEYIEKGNEILIYTDFI